MAIDPNKHKSVVMLNGPEGIVLGFPHIYNAFAFVEHQLTLVNDAAKEFSMILEAVTEDAGLEIGGIMYKIVDIDSYFDAYADVAEDEYPVAE